MDAGRGHERASLPVFSSPLPLWERVAPHEVRRRVRGILPLGKLCENVLQNGGRLLQHIVVPVALNPKSLSNQAGISCCITRRLGMLTAVYFDDDALLEAHEVENVSSERGPVVGTCTLQGVDRGAVATSPASASVGSCRIFFAKPRMRLATGRWLGGCGANPSPVASLREAPPSPTRGEGRSVSVSPGVLTPASASAHRARPCFPCPAPASASRDRRGSARRLRLRSGRRCRADSAS